MNKHEIEGLVARILGLKHLAFGTSFVLPWETRKEAIDALTTLSAENENLRAKVADLEGALQPFAYALETHEEVGRPYADDDRINIVQAYGCLLAELDESHFYQARQAIAGDDHGHR